MTMKFKSHEAMVAGQLEQQFGPRSDKDIKLGIKTLQRMLADRARSRALAKPFLRRFRRRSA